MTADTSQASQPYQQSKAELDAEENAKFELETRERRYELDGNPIYEIGYGDQRYETSAERSSRAQKEISLDARQELRGEEHS